MRISYRFDHSLTSSELRRMDVKAAEKLGWSDIGLTDGVWSGFPPLKLTHDPYPVRVEIPRYTTNRAHASDLLVELARFGVEWSIHYIPPKSPTDDESGYVVTFGDMCGSRSASKIEHAIMAAFLALCAYSGLENLPLTPDSRRVRRIVGNPTRYRSSEPETTEDVIKRKELRRGDR